MKISIIILSILLLIIILLLIMHNYNNINRNSKSINNFPNIETPASLEQKYFAKSWNTISPSGNLSFPEFYSSNLYGNNVPDINKVSIAISGGGPRSFNVTMGYFRALTKMGYKNKAKYVSSVSGGSWFYSLYSYYQTYGNVDVALGKSCGLDKNNIPNPSLMTLNEIQNLNTDLGNNYFGNLFTNSSKFDYLAIEYLSQNSDIPSDQCWNKLVNTYILESFGLDKNVPIALNKKHADDIYKRNSSLGYPLYLKDDMPFWLCDSTLFFNYVNIYPYMSVSLTPLYSGIPQKITIDNNTIGGMVIENFAFGNSSIPDNLPINNEKPVLNAYTISNIRNLSDSVGTSSFAIASGLFDPSVISYIGNLFPENIDNLLSEYYILVSSPNNRIFEKNLYLEKGYLGDGTHSNDTGIISLLTRGVKHIICFSNNYVLSSTNCETNIKPLFGLLNNSTCAISDLALDSIKVFASEDYTGNISLQFDRTFNSGGPCFARASLNVLDNKTYGVSSKDSNGNPYVVDILFIGLESSSKFISQLPPEVQSQIGTSFIDKFQNFPNFATVIQNETFLLYYTLGQVNLLSSYTEWCLNQPELKVHIDEMFSY